MEKKPFVNFMKQALDAKAPIRQFRKAAVFRLENVVTGDSILETAVMTSLENRLQQLYDKAMKNLSKRPNLFYAMRFWGQDVFQPVLLKVRLASVLLGFLLPQRVLTDASGCVRCR
jgi:hypothetical protein